jgi:hypothetical protein
MAVIRVLQREVGAYHFKRLTPHDTILPKRGNGSGAVFLEEKMKKARQMLKPENASQKKRRTVQTWRQNQSSPSCEG